MEEHTEPSDVALANGIIHLKEKNKKFCCLCSIYVPNLNKHIIWPRHKIYLERFNLMFVNHGKKVYCKKCSSNIGWQMINDHGIMHKIAPWYNSKPNCKTFFNNHTVKFHFGHYCFLCERIFDYWDTAASHFKETDHQNLKDTVGQPVNLQDKIYTLLVTQGFVPGRNMTIECKMCHETGLKTSHVREHFKTVEHKESRAKFIVDVTRRMKRQSFGNEDSDSDSLGTEESTSEMVKANPSKIDRNPKNIQVPYSRNMICNFSLRQSTEEMIPERKESLDETGNVLQERGTGKAECPKISAEEKPPKSAQEVPEPLHRDLPISYIVSSASDLCKAAIAGNDKQRKRKIAKQNKDEPDPYCLICYSEIPGHAAVKDHLTGKRHDTALKKYGCDNIVLIDGEHYFCTACECTISGFGNVYHHITSNTHLSSIGRAQGDEHESQNTLDKVENSMEPEEATKPSSESLPCLYIVKQNAKKSFCQICDKTQYPVATKNINDHITTQRHKIALKRYGCDNIVINGNNMYYCRCCHSELSSLENVYLHIKEKRHMSSLIKVCNKQEGQRSKRRVEAPTLPEDFDVSCQYLLSGYITKQINRSFPSKVHESSQCNMISNFTVEPNNAHCSTIPDSFEPLQRNWLSNSIERQNSGDFASRMIGNGVEAHNRLEDVYRTPSENRLGDDTTKQDTPLISSNMIPDTVEIAKQPELSMMMSSMATELSRFLAKCNTKEMKRRVEEPRRRVQIKQMLEFKAEAKKFYCTVCDAKAEDRTELHVHMASHYTEEFVRKRNRNNGTMNGCLTNDRTAEEGNHNGEAQQVPKTLLGQPEPLVGGKIANGVDNGPVNASNGLLNSTTGSSIPETAKIGTEDHKIDPTAEETPETLKSNTTPQKNNSSLKITDMKKIAELLDFDHDEIYDLGDKLEEVELGMMLGLVVDSRIYCLICRKVVDYTLDNYYEHLCSADHCAYLEEMEADNALFEDFSDQFSDLDLVQEYMQEISEDTVRCIICDEEICNNSRSLEAHIYHEVHERKCEETRAIARKHFEKIKPRMHCDWYDVQKYWCVVCLTNTESEVNFIKHLKSKKHANFIKRPENVGKRMIFDFCATCALLWYGYRCTYSYHSEIDSHKWLKRDGHYVSSSLPRYAKNLLASPEEFIDDKIKYLDKIHETECAREKQLIQDLEKAVKMRFPRAKAYAFGSRVSGLGSPDSDIDIFLDCRNVFDGNASTESQVLFFITGVHQSLSKDPQLWDVEELLTNCRSPIIKACHRATGLSCDISFENRLAVENTKLIKAFNQIFPTCRKITLFLKQWLLHCDLSGTDRITSYALYWYVIFYLQQELILPSVATLIAMKRRSHVIAGWEVGVTHDFVYNEESSTFSIKEFLIRFFTFYKDFDFRYDVACPLLGEVVKKRAFVDPRFLPEGMERYVAYMRNPGKPEPFRINSPMCIQDPFDLQHNLTKAVSKVYLNRFRKCCAKSLDLLWSS